MQIQPLRKLEESKETGGFVAGDPTGTASPWHTTLLAKSSVLYLREGDARSRVVAAMELDHGGKQLAAVEMLRIATG